MRRIRFVSLIPLCLLAPACGHDEEQARDGHWTAPVELRRVPPLEGIGNGQRLERPVVAVDDQGNGLVVWEELAVARGFSFPQDLWFATFTPARGWSEAARIEGSASRSGSIEGFDPRLVSTGQANFVLAWHSGARVFAARYGSSTGWGAPHDMGPGGVPALAANAKGGVVAAWHGSFDGTADTEGILMSRLEAGSFTAPRRVDTPQLIDNRLDGPGVVLDAAGEATVVFHRSLDIVAARVGAGSAPPEPETVLVHGRSVVLSREAPAAAVDSAGRVFALWRQEDPHSNPAARETWSLWSSRYSPGQGWSAPAPGPPTMERPGSTGTASWPAPAATPSSPGASIQWAKCARAASPAGQPSPRRAGPIRPGPGRSAVARGRRGREREGSLLFGLVPLRESIRRRPWMARSRAPPGQWPTSGRRGCERRGVARARLGRPQGVSASRFVRSGR